MSAPASSAAPKRAIAFIDGQNLYFAAFEAFGYHYPNYDPVALARAVCNQRGWELAGTRLYTGIPELAEDPLWHHFWSAKKTALTRQGVHVFTRSLRYRDQKRRIQDVRFDLPDGSTLRAGSALFDQRGKELPHGTELVVRVGEEKGIDVRLALDVIRLAREAKYDVAVIFSQDQDLSEVVQEVLELAKVQNREITLASAFPIGAANPRGINKTDWIRIDKATYDACIDPRDYRPAKP